MQPPTPRSRLSLQIGNAFFSNRKPRALSCRGRNRARPLRVPADATPGQLPSPCLRHAGGVSLLWTRSPCFPAVNACRPAPVGDPPASLLSRAGVVARPRPETARRLGSAAPRRPTDGDRPPATASRPAGMASKVVGVTSSSEEGRGGERGPKLPRPRLCWWMLASPTRGADRGDCLVLELGVLWVPVRVWTDVGGWRRLLTLRLLPFPPPPPLRSFSCVLWAAFLLISVVPTPHWRLSCPLWPLVRRVRGCSQTGRTRSAGTSSPTECWMY